MKNNICLLSDSYKMGHFSMLPEGTEYVYSYMEARKGATFNNTVFFGLQYLLKEYFTGSVLTAGKIQQAQAVIDTHLGPGAFNREGWENMLDKHQGMLPVRIKAVPEGTPISIDNIMMSVQNTDTESPWLTGYIETVLTHLWYASTVATLSRECKKMMKNYLNNTSENMERLDFMLHDFGFRGVSSVESAGSGGAGHLVNFQGTDTIQALEFAMEYYNAPVCAYSVPATEHSIMTALGEAGEMEMMGSLLDKYPEGILSVVIDSYDYIKFIENTHKAYGNKIMTGKCKVVFRPDSGEPVRTSLKVVELLAEKFGSYKNSKGYKALHPNIGVLWGDGIDKEGINHILDTLKSYGWSSDCIVFGMGGGLLQKVNRDTQRFAFKSSAQRRKGIWHDIWKDPVDKSKVSKRGKLKLIKEGKTFRTVSQQTSGEDLLEVVFENGELKRDMSFDEVRENAKL